MSRPLGENECSGSTPSAWRWAKIAVPPAGPTRTAPKGPKKARLAAREAREPVSLVVRYRGGAEGWWEIRARGKVLRVPGSMDVHSVLSRVVSGDMYEPR